MADALPGGRRSFPWLLLAASFAVLAPSLADFPVADCFSLLVKARDLSILEILRPDETGRGYTNPYYRPLFVLVLKAFQALAGPAGALQHAFVALLHGVAAWLVFLLGRELLRNHGTDERGSIGPLIAALLFLVHPANVTTVAWTTVAYATISGTLTALALLLLLRYLRTARLAWLAAGAAAAALGLLASQTPYCLPPALALYVLLFARDRTRIASVKAALLPLLALSALVLLHWTTLERQLSLTTFNPNQTVLRLPLWFLRTAPRYFLGYVGIETPALGVAMTIAAWSALGLVATLLAWRGGRLPFYLLLLALAGTLPYALADHSDRYAYFASIPAAILAGAGLGRLLATRARLVALAAIGVALAISVMVDLRRERELGELGEETRHVCQALERVRPRLTRPSQLFLVNVPAFHKWTAAWVLGYSWMDPPRAADGTPLGENRTPLVQWHNYYEAEGVRFAPPPKSLYPGDAVILEYREGTLVERTADDLGRGKIDYPISSFPRRLVIAASGTEAAMRDALAGVAGDPSDVVVLESKPPSITSADLPQGRILRQDRNEGEVEADGTTLLVMAVGYRPPDPLSRFVGQVGRLTDQVHVWVDGQPAPIYPAFYHFPAVPIPAGRHLVRVVIGPGRAP